MAHVELIQHGERLSPELGGTGYRPPAKAASVIELLADLSRTDGGRSDLGFTVWKVKRKSVDWHHHAPINERRIHIGKNRIACSILGSTRDWWFVAVDIARAKFLLAKTARQLSPEHGPPSSRLSL